MRKRISLHAGVLAAVIAAAVLAGEAASGVDGLAAAASPGVAACSELPGLARVKDDATAVEPEFYAKNEANAYGVHQGSADAWPTAASPSRRLPHDLRPPPAPPPGRSQVEDPDRRSDGRAQRLVLRPAPAPARPTPRSGSCSRHDLDGEQPTGTPSFPARPAREDMKQALNTGDCQDPQRLRGQHRRRAPRLGVLPEGLQQRPRLHRRHRHPRRVDARRERREVLAR